MPRYDYVLFDADNTLFDFDLAERKALRRALEEHGYPFDDVTESLYLAINRALWHRFDLGTIGREELLRERFAVFSHVMGGQDDPLEFNRCYLDHLAEGNDLLPGAEELCAALAPCCTRAIVTNGVASAQRGRFSRSPLPPYFSGLFISEELGCQKPQARFFELVLRAMDIRSPERAVVVGDNLLSDIQGGINAGLDTVWYNPNRLPNATTIRPTWEVHDFDALRALLLGDPIIPETR